MSFDRIHFGNIADFRNGLNYSRENMGVGLKVINVGDFGDRMLPDYESLGEIDPSGVAGDNDLLQEGDLLFVRSNGNRELVGRVMYITSPPQPVAYSGFCIRARMNAELVNPKFYYYLFRCKETRMSLVTGGVGANIVNVSQKTLTRFDAVHPPRDVQDKCVFALSTYDDLIDANRRRIQLLEKSAQLLYREWFVKLRFPGHEMAPAIDGVPEGWGKISLGAIVGFQKGRKPTAVYSEYQEGAVPHLLIDAMRGTSKREYCLPDKLVEVTDTDTIMVMDGSGSCELFLGYSGAIGSTLGRYRINQQSIPSPHWLYLLMLDNQREFKARNIGAAIPHANKDFINSYVVMTPSQAIAEKFELAVAPIFRQLIALRQYNEALVNARDLLLPKLLSGALDASRIIIPKEIEA